jgi:hypothetical protein
MADNITLNVGGGGDVLAADDIGGAKYQRVKLVHGPDGISLGDTASGNPLPVTAYNGYISTANSTVSYIASASSFTGSWEDITHFSSITVIGSATASGTLWLDFSIDGSNSIRNVQLSDGTNGSFGIHSLTVVAKYFRTRVTTSSVPASVLLQTILHKDAKVALPTSRMGQTLTEYSDVLNTRATLAGKTEGGDQWVPISAEAEGHLEVSIQNPRSAFGEVSIVSPLPVAQVDFVYGINTNLGTTAVTGAASALSSSGLLLLSTATASATVSSYRSERYLKYRPGQGAMARFTAVFSTGDTGSFQYAGIGSIAFNNGFFFGYQGSSFGICHRNRGAETWYPQSSWNVDVCDGSNSTSNYSGINLDPTKGNVYQIKYQYLGFGNIYFFIENPVNGQFTNVHTIQYPNANTQTSLGQPSLYATFRVANTTSTTNKTLSIGSLAMFLEGNKEYLGPRYGIDNSKTAVTTETNIFTLRNASSFNGVVNGSQVVIRTLSFGAQSTNNNGIATLRVIKNATLGGSPAYTAISGTLASSGLTITNGQSVVSYDVSGSTVASGTIVYNDVIALGTSESIKLDELNIYFNPGETLTFSVRSTQSASVGVAATWSEDI